MLDFVDKRDVNKQDNATATKQLLVLTWITRGCVLNWQSQSTGACLNSLLANLEITSGCRSMEAVKGFQLICSISDKDDVMTGTVCFDSVLNGRKENTDLILLGLM